MRHCMVGLAMLAGVLVPASAARAQDEPRWLIGIDVGAETATPDFEDAVVFSLNAEDGDLAADYRMGTGRAVGVQAAARLWRGLLVGVDVTSLDTPARASVSARLPHPLLFNSPRTVSGDSGDLDATEIGVHLQAAWMFALLERLDLMVGGGPSYIRREQPLVDQVTFDETFPFHTAAFTGVSPSVREKGAWGGHAAAQLLWALRRSFAVVGGTRFSRASIDVVSADGETLTVDVGGLQLFGGLRVRF